MLKQTKGLFLFCILTLSGLVFADTKPFFVVDSSATKSKTRYPGLLFEQGKYQVFKSNVAKPSDFIDLYRVNVRGTNTSLQTLERYGDILHLAKGEFAIMRVGQDKIAKLSGLQHKAGMACGTVIKLNGNTKSTKTILAPEPVIGVDTKLPQVESALTSVDANQIKATVEDLSKLHTRGFNSTTGKTVADLLLSMYQKYAQNREDVELTTFDHSQIEVLQPSLVVRIKGQTRPQEIVVLGSHIDSINGRDTEFERAPGADDNASGTATNLEIFRVLMEKGVRLDRTLEIHGYAAEEVGLLGSQHIAKTYADASKNVIAMVQFDMNLYSATGQDRVFFMTSDTQEDLTSNLGQLLTNYVPGIPHRTQWLPWWVGTSDHQSWTNNGYAAAFPFEDVNGYNHNIHSEEDTIANAPQFSQAQAFAKLGVAYVMHFAGSKS